MKISHRINLTHIIMLVILAVLLVGAVNFTMTTVFEEEIKEGEFAVAVHVARELTNPLLNDDFAQVQQFIDHEKMQPPLDIKYVYVIDRDGVVIAHTFPQVFPVELATANPVPPGENSSIQIVSLEGESINDIGIRIPDVADTNVHIGFSREPTLNIINMLNSQILGMTVFILLLSFVVSFFVIRTITRPIERLVEGTKKIGEGNLDYRIDVEGPDEIEVLAKSINRMTKDLKTSEANYCSVADSVADLIYIVDHNLRFLACNRKTLECMRVSKEDAIGRPLVEIIRDPDEKDFYQKNLQKILENGMPETHEREFDIMGQKRYYTMTMTPVFDAEGNVTAVACVGCDITERKRAEEALQESEERYRNVVELATDSIIVHREGRIVFVNPAAVTLFGAKGPEDLIGKSVLDFIPPENRELVSERMQHVLDTHEPARLIEEKLIRMDGSIINAEVTGTLITYCGEPAIQTMIHDITKRKRAEDELLFKHKQLLSIFDSIDEIVYIADPVTSELLYFNEAFRSRFGGNVGDKCYRVLQDEPSPCSFCSNKYIFGENLGKTYIWEWQNLVDRHWYRCIDRAIKWPDGRMVRYEMAIDVTERKRTEEELRNAHQQLLDIIEFLPDATFVIDAEKKVIAWNRAIEEMTGVKKEDIIGKGDYAYAVPFYGELRPILIDLVLDFDRDFEKEYDFVEKIGNTLLVETFVPLVYGGKGAYLWAIASPLFDSSGKLIGAVESIRNITERKRVEEALQEQKEFAANLVQYSATPTFVIDSQHKVLYWNLACEDLTGVKASELVGTDNHWKSVYDHKRPTLADMIIDGEFDNYAGLYSIFTPSLHASNGLHAEDWFPDVGGKEKYLIFDAAPIYNKEGELIAAVETIQDITKRKQAEEALEQSEERYRSVVELATDSIIVHSEEGRIIFVNPAAVTLVGAKGPKDLIGKTVLDIIPPENRELTREHIQQVIDTNEPLKGLEEKLLRRDGSVIDVDVTGTFITYGGEPAILIVLHDITERKRAEEALKQSEERYRNVVDLAADSIVVNGEEGRIIFVNPAAVTLVGARGPEDLIGKTVLDFIPPENRELTIKRIQYVFDKHEFLKNIEEKLIRLDGLVIDAEVSAGFIIYGGKPAILTVLRDITERKLAEEALKESEEKYREMIEGLAEAVYRMTLPDGRYEYFSPAVKDVFGYSAYDFINKPLLIREIIHPDFIGYFEEKWDDLVHGKVPPIYEYKVIDPEGHERWIRQSNKGIFTNEGNIIAIEGICRDITKQKLSEVEIHRYAEELKRSNELKDLFTDILRHDLLNPASIVKGYTEVLLEMEEEEKKLRSLKAIERNNQKLIDMIETASRFAMLESVEELEFKEMDIGAIFKEVVENFRSFLEEKKMVLEFAADGSYPSKVSPVIEEAFANLLSNAIKYSPEKSRIIIDIMDAGENWKVSVTDFGEGISDDDKPKLFERFKRVKKGAVKGTGLGLAIVKRLIDLHGGTVGIEDNPAGQGSVFWVTVKKA